MLARLSVLAFALLAGDVSAKHVINKHNGNIAADSTIGRQLLHHARRVENNEEDEEYDWQDIDTSFLAGYSFKFQGCHHVQQWNEDADDEEDVRIMTKRLVRFRLCPSTDCQSDMYGCTSKYGDYVVDMGTFLTAYMESGNQNAQYNQYNNGARKLDGNFDVADYTECQNFDMRRHLQNNNNYNYQAGGNANAGDGYYDADGNYQYYDAEDLEYYIGPYCADQGGEIHLGLFTDDTCTSFASNGETMFYQNSGYRLPYSEQSMVSMSCLSCGTYNGNYEVSEFCSGVYSYSGKCETKMNVEYPNESSCSYIEGIKIIREDGIIRTSATKKSKAAAVCIGIFLTIAVLLSGYVYYLRTKLGRAKINLAAASQTVS